MQAARVIGVDYCTYIDAKPGSAPPWHAEQVNVVFLLAACFGGRGSDPFLFAHAHAYSMPIPCSSHAHPGPTPQTGGRPGRESLQMAQRL